MKKALIIVMVMVMAMAWAAQSVNTQTAPTPQALPGGQAQNPRPTIQVSTGLVRLVVTVTDKQHNYITDLDQSDFKVFEDGAQQQIQHFARETDLPLRVALLLDTSNSIRPRLQFEQEAATDFLSLVIRRNVDMAFLMTFDNEPQVIQDYTGDAALLAGAIQKQRAGGGTALDDAMVMASKRLETPPPPSGADAEVRRVIVVISDGNDNLSDHPLSDAIQEALRAEACVYAVSTNTDWLAIDDESKPSKYHMDEGDKVLQNFADQTGGRAFFPYKADDLAQSFVAIETELRQQYLIAYAPSVPLAKGGYRTILVQTNRKGLTVRTRKGYYAGKS